MENQQIHPNLVTNFDLVVRSLVKASDLNKLIFFFMETSNQSVMYSGICMPQILTSFGVAVDGGMTSESVGKLEVTENYEHKRCR